MGNNLYGSYTAKFDKSSRIKIPEKFRKAIESEYGNELFITSLSDEAVQVYPLSVWENLTSLANQGAYHLNPAIRKFLLRVNRKGIRGKIDDKGRILINQGLREKAQLDDSVEIIAVTTHLEVWNKEKLDQTLEEKPLTNEDFEMIANIIPGAKTK
ncbi:MAG: hypothetical protein JXB26_20015 [Candidatus Aminicenantes bacterium]|nr:hypothetical protein [Candidatus Aminicenantes bacterium]